MDEINQIQNPNISPMPSMPQVTVKKGNYWFWIVVAIILVVGGLVWWYVGQMAVDAPIVGQPQINKEAREDMMISNDIQAVDPGNLDKEFMEIDKDLNSL